MGHDDGVGFAMRQVETAAQRVAQLVVKRHTYLAQHRAAQLGAEPAACVARWPARADACIGHQRYDRIAFLRMQPLDGMGDAADAADKRHGSRQRAR